MHRRSMIALAASAALPLGAPAQGAWPSRPVHIVVPAPAGSSLDLIVRTMGDKLGARWGQPVVVDNKAGAGGMLGMDAVAKAGDGHTLGIGFNGPVAFAPFLYRKMPYDPARDLVPVVMTTSQPNVLAVNADKVAARTVAEFVAWTRAQGGRMNYSSLGNGSSAHLTMELFLSEAGVQGMHIPFNGSPPAALAVAQGEADATFMVAPALLPHVKSHRLRLLAVSSSQRPDSLKDLPTLAAAGYPNVESLAWNGLFASPGTPEAVLARINGDVNEVLRDPGVRAAFEAQGLTAVGGSASEFRRVIEADVRRWGPVITRLGIRLD
jgi:tripartite-type tricarboxylate transporter receptor subunit TctC